MQYIQVETELRREEIEPVTGLLLTLGITDTAVEDPADLADILDKKNDFQWDYVDSELLNQQDAEPKLTFYMEDGQMARAEEICRQLQKNFPSVKIKLTEEDDSQWKDKWKEYFKPAQVTEKLVVKPTWETYEAAQGQRIIEIDPGMAFGTGTHETTSLCLKLMEKYIKAGDDVLDVGCGSGILSIGAALLGAGKTLAVDIDPEAVAVSIENVRLNGCQNSIEVKQGNLVDGLDFKADMVVANLMADLVMILSEHVAKHMKPGGVYISSGILVEKEEQVAEVIRSCGFEIVEIKEDGMWCAIAAVRRENGSVEG